MHRRLTAISYLLKLLSSNSVLPYKKQYCCEYVCFRVNKNVPDAIRNVSGIESIKPNKKAKKEKKNIPINLCQYKYWWLMIDYRINN